MSYRLRYNAEFMRQLERLPGDVRSIAQRTIKDLTAVPRPRQAKELEQHPTYFRLWLPRAHRLVYQINEDEQLVHLLYVGPKLPDLYERLGVGR